MKLILGHTNTDLDCFGSMILMQNLFPEYRLLKSRFIHPVARNLFTLFKDRLDMVTLKEIRNEPIENLIIVDTKSAARVKEFFREFPKDIGKIDVYDHHPADVLDIPDATLHQGNYGSNTTLIGLMLIDKGIQVKSDDATIALTGIYADTGNFTHENVTPQDFQVAHYLLDCGADIKVVKHLLKTLKEDHQITLFHELLNRMSYQMISGHFIAITKMSLEKQIGGLAAVVEKIFDVESPDAIFSIFTFEKEGDTLIIARSQKDNIALNTILKPFGGGGHTRASSALVKGVSGDYIQTTFLKYLESALVPAITASEIMTCKVDIIYDNWSLKEASIYLEKINHTGAPVLNDDGKICGFMTLRDIMKGRKSNAMHAPVKAYMTHKVITTKRSATLREIENTLFKHNIGHLPVVEEGEVVGIVTRTDFLSYIRSQGMEVLESIVPRDQVKED